MVSDDSLLMYYSGDEWIVESTKYGVFGFGLTKLEALKDFIFAAQNKGWT